MGERTAISWSSGKDGAWALHRARQTGQTVSGLLTVLDQGRVRGHGVPVELVREQARSLDLPLWEVTPDDPSNRAHVEAVTRALDHHGIDALWFGDLHLEEVRDWRRQVWGTRARFPLWGEPTDPLVREMLAEGVRALVVCVDTTLAPRQLLGRTLSPEFLSELPPSVDPAGERGEFHTLVTVGPGFRRPISPRWADVEDDGRFVRTVLVPGPQRGFGTEPFELPPY